jgi:phosphomannomutase
VVEFPEANLVRFQCGPHARVQVRPSGTEPKVKIYAEAIDADVEALIDAITRDLMGYSK